MIEVTYEQVAAAFADFSPHMEKGSIVRGGIARPDKKPHRARVNNQIPHVEMSFSPEQRGFIVEALSRMGLLAQGTVLGDDQTIPTYAERIEKHYLKDDPLSYYQNALLNSSLDLLTDFNTRFHPYMPAIDSMFQVAGAQGMSAVISRSLDDLFLASKGKLTPLLIPEQDFSSPHVISTEENQGYYEVQCSGEALAKILMKQSKIAAINLAKIATSVPQEHARGAHTRAFQYHVHNLLLLSYT